MRSFKSYLIEYITDSQRERYKNVHMTDKARADTDEFFGVGNDKVHGEIEHGEKSEIHKQLENHLGREVSHEEYNKGTVKDKHNRDVKIGRLIKDNDLRIQFDKDPSRQIAKAPTLKTTTVRGVEVAGQTNPVPNAEHPEGHSWKGYSCKNIESGINRRYLEPEIKHGTVVHYVHDHNGQEIYRATLHPHHNEHGDVAYGLDAEYGIKHPKFTADAQRVAKELSGEYKPGTFWKHPEVYNDNGKSNMFHPGISEGHISDILTHGSTSDKHDIMMHPAFTSDHVSKVLKYEPNGALRGHALLRSDLVTPEHITTALNDPDDHVKRMALHNGSKITADHVKRALEPDMPADIRRHMAKNRHATPELLSQVIKHDPNSEVVQTAVMNKNATPEHITQALQHPDVYVRQAALTRSDLVNDSHLHTAVRDSSPRITTHAAFHHKAKPEHLDYIMDHGHNNALEAMFHRESNATSEHIGKALRSTDPRFTTTIKEFAASHPNASSENIMDALKLNNPRITYDVIDNHDNLSKEHMDHIVKHTPDDDDMISAISRHPSLRAEHITHLLDRPGISKNIFASRIYKQLANHRNLAPEHMERLAKHDNWNVRNIIANRHDAPAHVLSHIVRHDPEEANRYDAIMNDNTHPDDLEHAVKHDESVFNKEAALRNFNTPVHAIKHVLDTYKTGDLRKQAISSLRQRGIQAE
jgi:hypothetical protein